jgi:biotin carboxyl carrier protein
MQFDIDVGTRVCHLVVNPSGGGFAVSIDGRSFYVDVARVDPYTLSLLVDKVCSHEVVVAPDAARSEGPQFTVLVGATPVVVHLNGRRHTRRDDRAPAASSGPQRVVAPMPGKVVRVRVAPGDTVSAGQPLVVVEAMKMENELRATRDGVVADIHAREGMSVDAGTLLVVVQ